LEDDFDASNISDKIKAMKFLNVPYPDGYENIAYKDVAAQALEVTANLKTAGIKADPKREIIALIAYLQRLGTDIKAMNNPYPGAK
jgi:cytochrome c oxidase cbb3-type subunit I/II